MQLPHTSLRFIFHFVRRQPIKFGILIFTFIAWAVNDVFFPYFLKQIINTLAHYHGVPNNIYAAVKNVLLLLGLFFLVSEILLRVQGFIQVYAFPKFRTQIREAAFDYIKSHSYEYFVSNFAGNIAKKLADLPTSSQNVMEIICFQFVTAATGAVIVFIMMWLTKPIFAVVLFLWLCIHLTITILFLRRGNKLWENHSDAVSILSGKIVDVFTNILNVHLFAQSQHEANYIKHFQQDEIQKSQKAMLLIELMRVFLGINGLGMIFGTLFLLLYGWSHHWVTLGDFTQIEMQTMWLLGWIWYVSFQMSLFARETGTISNALRLIQKSHDLVDKPNAKPIHIHKGKIYFQNVSFEYQPKKAVFQHLHITIPAGQKIGLVGFSGSGKSTFVNLILRFYDLTAGRVLIDDQDIANVTQDSLRAQIAMIPQDPSLFHRTLMENIRYGRLEATDEEVIQASKLAHCHEFIEKLEDGYQSLVGERGIKLSGGQRQRIAIARAILKNAPILILDEATSSLDSVTEKLIQESLRQLMRDRTTIVIAHRLSTLTNMDKILVFDKGQIVEKGRKESLLAHNGHFAKLWHMQKDGFFPDNNVE